MKTHQTRLDTIGNNIANVNTYGFKSSRVTFRDIYYQTLRGAAEGTGNKGGLNPSQVGYGTMVGSIDMLVTQSAVSNTSNPLDQAIVGDGFFQVMDQDGNKYYTKAGMLDIDSMGNLVDVNGNFVLGVSGNPLGKGPDSQKINLNTAIPAIQPTKPSRTETIGNTSYTFSASKESKEGNISIQLVSGADLPIGVKCEAVLTSSAITVRVNPKETFTSLGELETEMNAAIKKANNGEEHPGGTFSISSDPPLTFPQGGLTGEQLVADAKGVDLGTYTMPNNSWGFTAGEVGDKFSGKGEGHYELYHLRDDTNADGKFGPGEEYFMMVQSFTDNTDPANPIITQYAAVLTPEQMKTSGSVKLVQIGSGNPPPLPLDQSNGGDKTAAQAAWGLVNTTVGSVTASTSADADDYTVMNFPSYTALLGQASAWTGYGEYIAADPTATPPVVGNEAQWPTGAVAGQSGPLLNTATGVLSFHNSNDGGATFLDWPEVTDEAEPSEPSKNLGLGTKAFLLQDGTEGTEQPTINDVSSLSIGADGVISATHPQKGLIELGRIDLAVFTNAKGLTQSGNTYYVESANSGPAELCKAGENNSGLLKSSSLEMSNVDLAQEFTDMITTQRGYQANSRIITVTDTMLEELINLKR